MSRHIGDEASRDYVYCTGRWTRVGGTDTHVGVVRRTNRNRPRVLSLAIAMSFLATDVVDRDLSLDLSRSYPAAGRVA